MSGTYSFLTHVTRATVTLALLGACGGAGAQTITVTTVEDSVDFTGGQQVGDLPGPDGEVSFREAVKAANNTAGPQTIEFAIPMSDWWLYDDRAILRLEDGLFNVTDDETTIDFSSQTDYTGDTNPDGNEVGIYGLQPNAWGVQAIQISADNCTVIGLDRVMQRGFGVSISGNNNRVISCTISGSLYAAVEIQGNVPVPAAYNVIGGTEPGEGNVLSGGNSGVRVDGPALGNVVIGNTIVGSPYAGVEIRGAYCCPDYTPYDTRIGGPTPEEANWIADNGKFGEEGFPLGDQVRAEWAVDTVVEGNLIGTIQDGSARYPGAHGTAGVAVRESENTIVRGNLISGIVKEGVNHHDGEFYGDAVKIYGPNTGVVIEGNVIGADVTGMNPVPNLYGVTFSWFQGVPDGGQVGGLEPLQGNLVAFNERDGIRISESTGVTISGNAVAENGNLGIVLANGANANQNAPNITNAVAVGPTLSISGTFTGQSGDTYRLEFFANDACDPSGFGEGEIFLGWAEVVAAGSSTPFDVDISAVVEDGQVLTATATQLSTGNTSAFSACATIEGDSGIPGDLDGDGDVDQADLGILLGDWGCTGGDCEGDVDGDGDVDQADLGELLGNYGV